MHGGKKDENKEKENIRGISERRPNNKNQKY